MPPLSAFPLIIMKRINANDRQRKGIRMSPIKAQIPFEIQTVDDTGGRIDNSHLYQNDKMHHTRALWLWGTNLAAFLVHLAMGTAVSIQGQIVSQNNTRLKYTVYDIIGNWQNAGANGYVFVLKEAGYVRLDMLCALFAFLSAGFHFLIVVSTINVALGLSFLNELTKYTSDLYYNGIENCILWWRWVEYSLSAPVMNVALFLISGVRERTILWFAFFMQSAVCLCGLLTELGAGVEVSTNKKKKWKGGPLRRLAPFIVGCYLYVPLWVFYVMSYDRNVMEAWETRQMSPPSWVPYIIAAQIGIFSLFTFPVLIFQFLNPDHYWITELIYAVLSLTSKTVLNATLLANVIRLGSTDKWDVWQGDLDP
tara:strand:+ start:947 stop:2047 length:1101 start_codon:yes stop_codon:yes gene_type:complete